MISTKTMRPVTALSRRSYASSSLEAYHKLNGRAWKGTSVDGGATKNFIAGKFVESKASKHYDVLNPATQDLVTRTPQTTPEELKEAFESAQDAFQTWRKTSLFSRQNILFKYQALIRQYQSEIAASITLEQGKTHADAMGDVFRGLQVVDTATAIPSFLKGEHVEVAKDMDTFSIRLPLGVVSAICPFNFPAMIPLWSIPNAIATGNTIVLKPSERTPSASMILAELAQEAGVPDGVLSVVHGAHDTVNGILDAPQVKAISFVGGDTAGKYIHGRGTAQGKRVQSNMAAKNHCVLLPDANQNDALNGIVGAFAGAAGQRCMALSVLITVGKAKEWIPELVKRASELVVGSGFDKSTDVGPVISPAAKDRITGLITKSVEEGAELLLDGRKAEVKGFEKGNWLAPSVLKGTPKNVGYTTELFGPALYIIEAESIDEAIDIINANPYGNGASIYTSSGAAARYFTHTAEPGQIGVNVPIPVPAPTFSWSGNKSSVRGEIPFYGQQGLNFYLQNKTVTSSWKVQDVDSTRGTVSMPIHQ